MCFACGSVWPPFSQRIQVAPPPSKTETIYVDDNTTFYPDHRTGIHPPGPVYQTTGAAAPEMFVQGMAGVYPFQHAYGSSATYPIPTNCNYQIPGFNGQQFMYPQAGWPYTFSFPYSVLYNPPSYLSFDNHSFSEPPHSIHYPNYVHSATHLQYPSLTAGNMMPGQFQMTDSPSTLTAQAAAAAEHNKQLAAAPNGPTYFVGMNPGDHTAQQPMFVQGMGMAPAMTGTTSTTLAPYKPGEANSFWCRETDGAWTLRGYSDICLGEVSPGHWEKHAVSGYFFWVRHLS